ncbi:MAG: hypothetical protein JRF33_17990 [Deltaproteobacteria bacterium]|nr:hypothetical protein [Deltaproteobacteria bacterium]
MKTSSFFLLFFFLCACGSGQGSVDAGMDDGMDDGASGSDLGDRVQYADGITLRIPPDFSLCSMNGLWNQLQLPFFKTRASLIEGDWSLPLDQDEFELDLIGQVVTSPDGAESSALGPGVFRFWRTASGGGFPDYCIFNYRQPFQTGAGSYEIYFSFYLECEEGAIWEMPDNLGPGSYPCDSLAENTPGHVTATVTNGDQIEFDYYYYEGCAKSVGEGICPTYYGDPSRGCFVRGQDERETTDFFGLALSCIHHGFPRTFLMVFDSPLEGIHAVVLDDQPNPAELRYLDTNYSVLSTVAVESITYD